MKSRTAFTLIEVVMVIIVVAILSAVSVSMMEARVRSAKWAEGKAMTGAIARALRVHIAEEGDNFASVPTLEQLGFKPNHLNGTYFSGGESGEGNFSWVINNNKPIDFLVTATAPPGITAPSQITLDHTGRFTETP